jgi:hypothetical protein
MNPNDYGAIAQIVVTLALLTYATYKAIRTSRRKV